MIKILQLLKNNPLYSTNITCWKDIPAKEGEYDDFPEGISSELIDVLRDKGIYRLYSHQTEAISKILNDENVVIVTPAASGKTLCYNLPVVNQILMDDNTRALYLFPTKALSQDQLRELYDMTQPLNRGIKVYTFDGDTPQSARKAIRLSGHIVVTNPDILHTGILPHHTNWLKLFENLKFVVIDEIHNYRGVFGSHLSNVIRRLKRICKFYGSKPQFICCSATIANPLDLTQNVVEEKFELVDRNGAPTGEKHFILYNPPVVNYELGIRKSSIHTATSLAMRFISEKFQTIVFARSRLRVEIIVKYLKRLVERIKRDPEIIKGYRGGYLPNERRAIEEGIKNGEIMGVVSTNALELGIDIGQLRVSIMAGYPGTIASTWQQGGRAGRRNEEAVIILVASSAPIDQYIINHPEYFFGLSPEVGMINANNFPILVSHIKCAAFELPFNDKERFGELDITPILERLDQEKILRHTGEKWYWSSEVYPAEEVSLRSPTVENFVIVNKSRNNEVIGEIDYDSAPYLIHEDAIYIHQSQLFFIDKLDWEGRTAYAREVDVDYYTDAIAKTNIKVMNTDNTIYPEENIKKGVINFAQSIHYGQVSVSTLVTKYKKIKFETHESVGYGDIHLPENEMQTDSFWIAFNPVIKERLEEMELDLGGGLKALATVLRNVIPVFVLCDPRDIAAIPQLRSRYDDQTPTIYVYDKYPGGIGISKKVFEIYPDIFKAASELMQNCQCGRGCPSCVGPVIEVGEKGKDTALKILESLNL